MQNVPLWGGALSIRMPPRFKDISKFRQVPDTQEVFVDEQTDQVIEKCPMHCEWTIALEEYSYTCVNFVNKAIEMYIHMYFNHAKILDMIMHDRTCMKTVCHVLRHLVERYP